MSNLMKSFQAKPLEVERKWLLWLTPKGKQLGSLATQVASILRGKHKPTFHPKCGYRGIMSSSLIQTQIQFTRNKFQR